MSRDMAIYGLFCWDAEVATSNTSIQLQPSVALLARPTFGGLWSQNCLKKEHILWEDMIFWITCLSGRHYDG